MDVQAHALYLAITSQDGPPKADTEKEFDS